jgi:two-component system CheB/CheR fusion protein
LLGNAAKFTDRGGEVTVRLTVDGARRAAVLTVTDTGIGVDPQLLPKLFEAFVQADRSVERSRGGLGLGLALVKGIVELHGGTVGAVSKGAGAGSTFTVELPLIDVESPEPTGDERQPEPARRRVLVVEDNEDSAESLKMYLEILGHDVTVAHSGPDGVERARVLSPDVVFCDIGLPGMSGHAACAEMRKQPGLERTLFVALSGYAAAHDQPEQNGFDLHLLKPVDLSRVARIIAEHQSTSTD